MINCLREANEQCCIDRNISSSIFGSCARLITSLTSEGIKFRLSSDLIVFVNRHGVEKVYFDRKLVEDPDCQYIPQEITLDLQKTIVRLTQDFTDAWIKGASSGDLVNAIQLLNVFKKSDGTIIHGFVDHFAENYFGSIDYCIEFRGKVLKFLEDRKKPGYQVPALISVSAANNSEANDTNFCTKQDMAALQDTLNNLAKMIGKNQAAMEARFKAIEESIIQTNQVLANVSTISQSFSSKNTEHINITAKKLDKITRSVKNLSSETDSRFKAIEESMAKASPAVISSSTGNQSLNSNTNDNFECNTKKLDKIARSMKNLTKVISTNHIAMDSRFEAIEALITQPTPINSTTAQ